MKRADELQAIAKDHGVVAVAKHIVDEDKALGISEDEYTSLITEAAKRQALPGETDACAFTRLYMQKNDDGNALRAAMRIVRSNKLLDITKTQTDGVPR